MLKYQKWLINNSKTLKGKWILIVGGTGEIGRSLIEHLLFLNAKIIVGARNLEKAQLMKENLLNDYPQAEIYLEQVDVSLLSSIDDFQLRIDQNYPKIDYFINNAGIYSLPKTFTKEGYEIHFATNALGNYYLAKKIIYNLNSNAKIIFTSSISYKFYEINFKDFEGRKYRSGLKRYAVTKRIMTYNAQAINNQLKDSNITVSLVHPGICATELFTKNDKKIYRFLYPIMRLIFHKADKASLAIVKGLFDETNFNEWIGPGILNVWGYPKIRKLNRKLCDYRKIRWVNDLTNDIIKNRTDKE